MTKFWMHAEDTIMSGTTRTQIHGAKTLDLPDSARSILSIIPITGIDTPTAGEPTAIKLDIESDDVNLKPYEVLAPVGNSLLGKGSGNTITTIPKRFPIGANCPGSAKLKIWGTGLLDHTGEPYLGCTVEVSTEPVMIPRVRAKLGTYTTTPTSPTQKAGTSYAITGGSNLVEAYGAVTLDTVASKELVCGYFKFESNEFTPNIPIHVPFAPIHGALTVDPNGTDSVQAGACQIIGLGQDVGIKSASTTIQDYIVTKAGPSSAGHFITGVLYR